ncbi:DedA family protein [Candidatus Dojkabacteria bacterium]|nr:DedA family protein [Candidatus Dojkabacteria bacterium]
MELITTWLNYVIENYGYVGIFIAIALESVIVPIPSEIVMALVGYMAYRGSVNIFFASFAGALGTVVGCLIIYVLGYYLGDQLIPKVGKYLGISNDDYQKVKEKFNKMGEKAVLFSQVIPAVRSLIAAPAGVARMNIVRFVLSVFTGAFLWCLFLSVIGMTFGDNWEKFAGILDRVENVIYLILALIVIAVFIYLLIRKRKQTKLTTKK